MYKIYLAGPITGWSYDQCTNWREYVAQEISEEIQCISPMRGKDELKGSVLIHEEYKDHPMCSASAITNRDRFDLSRSNAVLMHLPEPPNGKISIGTMIELGWADAQRIPVVVVMKENSAYNHPMLTNIASIIVPDLDMGIAAIESIILP